MEYCDGGDINHLLNKCKKDKDYIAEDVIWKIFSNLVFAIFECHNHKKGKILHRDIKPGNIFLDNNFNVKLGDFGLSKMLNQESQFATSHVGTPFYMSPEQINDCKYNEKSDIWSLGCVLYELAALHPPFEANNHLTLALKIKNGKFDRIPMKYSQEMQRICEWILKLNPMDRPSAEDLLNIPNISLRLREKRLKENYALLKKKEEEIKKKEKELEEREKQLLLKMNELKIKEENFRYNKDKDSITNSKERIEKSTSHFEVLTSRENIPRVNLLSKKNSSKMLLLNKGKENYKNTSSKEVIQSDENLVSRQDSHCKDFKNLTLTKIAFENTLGKHLSFVEKKNSNAILHRIC